MASFLSDEHVHPHINAGLRAKGHIVRTVREFSEEKSGDGWDDETVFRFAIERKWIVITCNESDFRNLAKTIHWHFGVLIVNSDHDPKVVSKRIDQAVRKAKRELRGKFIRFCDLGASP